MTFQKYSVQSRALIEENLINFINKKKNENIPTVFKKQNALELLEKFVLRGKMIRGTLFLLSLEMMGEKITDEYLDVACSIELVHSALLIQDDIIDNDRTRRGHDTIFVEYEKRGERIHAANKGHYGISIGIVVADMAIFLAMDLLSHYQGMFLQKLLEFYAHEIYLVSIAEGIDSELGQSEIEPKKEDIYAVYKYKTARYTFSLPFVMAGIIAGNQKEAKIFEELGELIGLIFQLKDDVIGLFGDEKTIGKPVGSDIRENKKTLIRVLLYEHVNQSEKKNLEDAFGNKNITFSQIENVKTLVKKYKIIDVINGEIDEIMNRAWRLFKTLEVSQEHKMILKDLMEFNLKRSF